VSCKFTIFQSYLARARSFAVLRDLVVVSKDSINKGAKNIYLIDQDIIIK